MADVVETPIEGGENLPSSVEQNTFDPSRWDAGTLDDGLLKDGKLFGQYESLNDLHAGYKELQDKHTSYVREIKEGARTDESNLESIQATRDADDKSRLVMSDLVNKMLVDNVVTDEMTAQLEENNLDVRDLKLNAISAKENAQQAYDIVGGMENYQAMQLWAKDALSQDVQDDFNKNIAGASASLYIKGLYAQYSEANTSTNTPVVDVQRVSGESTHTSAASGYTTQAEMLKDVAYINGKGKSDKGARQLHERRLARTSKDVIYG